VRGLSWKAAGHAGQKCYQYESSIRSTFPAHRSAMPVCAGLGFRALFPRRHKTNGDRRCAQDRCLNGDRAIEVTRLRTLSIGNSHQRPSLLCGPVRRTPILQKSPVGTCQETHQSSGCSTPRLPAPFVRSPLNLHFCHVECSIGG
jgi:hypothetical protein